MASESRARLKARQTGFKQVDLRLLLKQEVGSSGKTADQTVDVSDFSLVCIQVKSE